FFDERIDISNLVSSYYYNALDWNGIIPNNTYRFSGVQVPDINNRNQKKLKHYSEEIQQRRDYAGKPVKPRQTPIQNALSTQLLDFFKPQQFQVTTEEGRVDITVTAPDGKKSFIEIKPASSARQSIREALGQLMEYSYYPDSERAHRLIIVSDMKLEETDQKYLSYIRSKFGIPITYFHWPTDKKSLNNDEFKIFNPNQ
ncbi:MAG: hypothetical protein LBR11_11160, partial [Deltaproteobacteria bacterium]|nr:hypothetical protein [Deltaproteobacteria bacterium]